MIVLLALFLTKVAGGGQQLLSKEKKQYIGIPLSVFVMEAVFTLISKPEYKYLEGMCAAWSMIYILLLCGCMENKKLKKKSNEGNNNDF